MKSKLDLTVKQALNILSVMESRKQEYSKINDLLRSVQEDFPSYQTAVDAKIEIAVVTLLDQILGDELASYYLYECLNMPKGGSISPNMKKYPKLSYKLKSVKDVEKYLLEKTRTSNFTKNIKK